jgi:hypothetical protein
MNTLSIHFNKKMPALAAELPYEYALFRALCAAALCVALAYVYLVSSSVLNVIAQRESDAASGLRESALGELEAHYFSLSKNITQEEAASIGLSPIKESSYVYRLRTVGLNRASSHNAI